jgi:hypothetical protein
MSWWWHGLCRAKWARLLAGCDNLDEERINSYDVRHIGVLCFSHTSVYLPAGDCEGGHQVKALRDMDDETSSVGRSE